MSISGKGPWFDYDDVRHATLSAGLSRGKWGKRIPAIGADWPVATPEPCVEVGPDEYDRLFPGSLVV